MIVASQKPIDEIKGFIADHRRIMLLGCGTCVTVCNAGGEREVSVLAPLIRLGTGKAVVEKTIERQCDAEFFAPVKDPARECDAILSMACGVGVQLAARLFPDKAVYPALNTQFMGINEGAGEWSEACLGCGDCKLGIFGGVCPVTQCSKSLCNGPCGGSEDGMCEVDPEKIECGWQKIYDRLKALGRLAALETVEPPRDWSKTHDGRPRKLRRDDLAGMG
jgi:ferredoxin